MKRGHTTRDLSTLRRLAGPMLMLVAALTVSVAADAKPPIETIDCANCAVSI